MTQQITPTVAETTLHDVEIQYGDVKVTLPNIQDTGRMPIVLLRAAMVASNGLDRITQEEQTDIYAAFLAYFMRDYPRLVAEIDRKSGDKTKDLERIIAAWVGGSTADPKA